MQNTLKIGICDDEKVDYNELKKCIADYSKQTGISFKLSYYKSGVELIGCNDINNLDILFLDIDMPELDGIETAYRLDDWKNCKIIMFTSKTERFKDAFKIGAFRFVTKPIEKQEVFDAIDAVRKRLLGNKEIVVYHENNTYSIIQKDIMYVMIQKTSSYIFTLKNDFRSDESLTWWEEELDERLFFRCHKSYIVNMQNIQIINEHIILKTGERIPLARRRKKELLQRFMEYDTKYR